MRMPRPTEEHKLRFRDLVGELPDVTVKAMFANLGAFTAGTMFAALVGDMIGVKLAEADLLDAARAEPAALPFGPGEKPLRDYVGFAADSDDELLLTWLGAAHALVHREGVTG